MQPARKIERYSVWQSPDGRYFYLAFGWPDSWVSRKWKKLPYIIRTIPHELQVEYVLSPCPYHKRSHESGSGYLPSGSDVRSVEHSNAVHSGVGSNGGSGRSQFQGEGAMGIQEGSL